MVGWSVDRALLVASSAVLVAACGMLPELRISRERAIAVAIEHAKLANPVVVAVDEGNWRLGEQRPAWVVTLRGDYLSCAGPVDPASPDWDRCEVVDGDALIYVDSATGAYLGGKVGGPIVMPGGP